MAQNGKTIRTRVQLKSDTEENWDKSVLLADGGTKTSGTSFVPLMGELIVYSEDSTYPYSRLKIGDGQTNVVRLPFVGNLNSYTKRLSFPQQGEIGKLYIDLTAKLIYYYDGTEYFQLSDCVYNVEKTSVSVISNFDRGSISRVSARRGVVTFRHGTLPSLNSYNISVVQNVTKEGST